MKMSSERADPITSSSERQDKRRNSITWWVRPMRHEDIAKCLEIWLQVELCEGHQTVASSLETDPAGFYVAELVPTGEVIGMCAGSMASEDTAFMGFYAVEPKYQGIGVGRELWATTMKRLDESINVGLYGVPAMAYKYRKSGFKVEDTIRMLIFESEPGKQVRLDRLCDYDELRSKRPSEELELHLINQETNEQILNKMIEYDRMVNKFSREKLLRNYLANKSNAPLTLALVRVSSGGGGGRRKASSEDSSLPMEQGHERDSTDTGAVDNGDELSRRVGGCLKLGADPVKHNDDHDDLKRLAEVEVLGYGCIRDDNTGGAMIGPLYADSGDMAEVILRHLLERFDLKPAGKYSAMPLTSNSQAGEILARLDLEELDQCSRMFTKFVPEATTSKIFYVHSPNFSLF